MTLKQFATGVFYLPAGVFSGLTNLFLGSYVKDNRGNYVTDDEGNYMRNRGLFGLTLDAAKYIGTGISNFISNHKKAIAVAFWSSLAVAGIAALTVALWPAALAAVTGFTVFGVSIASVVGTGFAAQVAATAGVAGALTSVGVYVGATVVNAFNALKDCFTNWRKSSSKSENESVNDENFDEVRRNQFGGLNDGKDKRVELSSSHSSSEEEPVQTKSVFVDPNKKSAPVIEEQQPSLTSSVK